MLKKGIQLSNLSVDLLKDCLLYTSDAADERSSVDLGGRRIIKKKKERIYVYCVIHIQKTKTTIKIQTQTDIQNK